MSLDHKYDGLWGGNEVEQPGVLVLKEHVGQHVEVEHGAVGMYVYDSEDSPVPSERSPQRTVDRLTYTATRFHQLHCPRAIQMAFSLDTNELQRFLPGAQPRESGCGIFRRMSAQSSSKAYLTERMTAANWGAD